MLPGGAIGNIMVMIDKYWVSVQNKIRNTWRKSCTRQCAINPRRTCLDLTSHHGRKAARNCLIYDMVYVICRLEDIEYRTHSVTI
jgi:hypothetical protein